ncbi:toprim domain-containing protein [Spirosoma validum]|uniref:Toprim domain-containing protein n=1 Tax=Spirosoma validum TaxID=2771355 RepID=A0A927GBA3_9BACT|nr:toprim domain-containing protein [Spirosoma validum]MBD2751389.1 toprim domain-containing protein [Spirosoma validum]
MHYRIGQKQYYAVGFGNDKGGFELRNRYFKGSTSPKWFTHLPAEGSTAINLFEGVFDFLSFCQFFKAHKLSNPTIILNSLSFVNDALLILSKYVTINAFLDNDKAGKRELERLVKGGINVWDCSHYYPNTKDFNEHITGHFFA